VVPLVRIMITVAAALVVALMATKAPAHWAPFILIAAPTALLLVVLIRRVDPKWFFAAFVLSTFLGWSRISSSFGRVNLRLIDVPFVLLVASLLLASNRTSVQRADIGQRLLTVLLFVFLLSLLPLLVLDPNGFFSPFVSWLRVIETFSLVWLMPHMFKRRSDARFIMGTVVGACTIELGRALMGAIASGQLSDRLQGGNGPDTEGLLAAVLIVTVLYGMVPKWPGARIALIGLGVLSLVMT